MRLPVWATRGLTVATAAGLVAVGAVAPAAAAAHAGVTTSAAPAAAQVATSDDGETDGDAAERRRQRLAVACARVPNVITRTENLAERLDGDEGRRGSLAWLETQVERAEEREREELATALRNRLEVRRELAELLPLRLDALNRAQEACAEADL